MRDDLLPFFQNTDELDSIIKHRTHIWEYCVFLAIQNDEYKLAGFKAIIEIMVKAQKDPNTFKRIERHYYPLIREALQSAHDAAHLAQDEIDYTNRTDVTATFQCIDIMLEGCVLPMLRQVASQHYASISKFNNMTFGGIISHFLDIVDMRSLLTPSLWNIQLNQIRNIASHKSYELNKKKKNIVCKYGQGKICSITIPIKHMDIFLHDLYLTCYTIKSALMLSAADNRWATKGLVEESDISLDTMAMCFGESIISQGLEIKKFNYEGPIWKLEAVDTLYRGEWAVREILNSTSNILSIKDVEIQFRVQITEEGHIFYGRFTNKGPKF
jgi:hypothetical protein